MKTYFYKATNKKNEVLSGTQLAKNKDDLFHLLQKQSLSLISAKRKITIPSLKKNWKEKLLKRMPVTKKTQTEFTHGIPLLLNSGCSIIEAINIVANNSESRIMKNVLNIIRMRLERGESLVQAFSGFPFIFPDLFLSYLATSTVSNQIQAVFENIATERRIKRQFIFGIIVPNIPYIAFLFLCIATWVLFYHTSLQEIKVGYKALRITTPNLIKQVISVTTYIDQNFFTVALYLILGFAIFRLFQIISAIRLATDYIYSKIPLINRLVRETAIIQYATALNLGLTIGYNLIQCSRIAKKSIGNKYFARIANKIDEDLNNAIPLQQCIIKHKFFHKIESHLLGFAEKSSKLTDTLDQIIENNSQKREAGFLLLKEFIKIFVLATGFASLSLLIEVISLATTTLLQSVKIFG